MESLPKINHSHLSLKLNHSVLQRASKFNRSSLPSLFSSLPPFSPIRASSPSHNAFHKPHQNPILSPLVKPACIAIAATAFFLTRLPSPPVAAASPPPEPAALEILPNESATEEIPSTDTETEIDALQSLLQDKIRARDIDEAIVILDRLIELEPEDSEYPLLKAHLHMRYGEHELAAKLFEELLLKDPFHVEAYRGLVMLTSETNKPTGELLNIIEEAAKACEEQERDSDARDLKLLIAQILVIDGDLSDALKVYEHLVREEPKDFRPYLCQGIVYTILRMKDEAEKQFEKYRSLVPEDHPYKQYFEDNTQFLEMRGVSAKS